MAKKILVSSSRFAIVDDEDFEDLNKWNWQCNGDGYATRHVRTGSSRICIVMHRVIMDAPDESQVDHINRNTLDNRKENLRLCTRQQNSRNRPKQVNNTSGYKGVYYYKPTGKWRAQITINGKRTGIGYFTSAIEAAKAYDNVAKEQYKNFAYLNFGGE